MHRALLLLAILILPPIASAEPAPPAVHRVTSLAGWDVNAFIVEGPEAVFLVDGLFLLPDVHALADRVERIGKPVAGLLLTHPHPDHFGGLVTLRERLGEFPIHASATTIETLPAKFQEYTQGPGFAGQLGLPSFQTVLVPDRTVADGDRLELAGYTIRVQTMGQGEAADTTLYWIEGLDSVFVGDIVMPYHHQYLGEGHAAAALAQMRALQAMVNDDTRILWGHGDNAPPAILDEGIAYAEAVIEAADLAMADPANRGEDGHLTRAARRVVIDRLLPEFVGLSHFDLGGATMLAWNIHGREQEILAAEADQG